jgi:MFS family permease
MADPSAAAAPASPDAAAVPDRRRFVVLFGSVWLLLVTAGGMFLIVVSLKSIAQDFGWPRAVPSLGYSFQFLGSGLGGLVMGHVLDRLGFGVPAIIGALMIGFGSMLVSQVDAAWQLHLIYFVMFGLAGQGALVAPAMANIARWFNRRRGMAVGMVAGGQSLAGIVWPPVFGYVIEDIGWRQLYFWFGVFALVVLPPVCWLIRHKAPAVAGGAGPAATAGTAPAGVARPALSPRAIQWLLCAAITGCCVAMALPLAHLVAYTTDRGFPITNGVEILALTLVAAFLARTLLLGPLSERVGGLRTLFLFCFIQAVTLAALTAADELWMLYAAGILFGLGYGGVFPAYALTIREQIPLAEVGRRTGFVFLFGAASMGLGSWMGGRLFDLTGAYTLPFLIGVGFNAANLCVVGYLIFRTGTGTGAGAGRLRPVPA